jgi:hypothetical protein
MKTKYSIEGGTRGERSVRKLSERSNLRIFFLLFLNPKNLNEVRYKGRDGKAEKISAVL